MNTRTGTRTSKSRPEIEPPANPGKRHAREMLVPLLLLWMFLACCFPLFDTDLFWHLKTGEWILQNGTVPGYDLYTFVDFNNRWIDLHWGFQVTAAILYRIGGANLLILSKSAILTLALGIGCYGTGRGLTGWQRAACWILPAITISGRGYERPEIVTVLCLAIWMAIVSRLETRPRLIRLLPLLQVIWINCHALYILGLVVGVCYAIDCVARKMAGGRYGLGTLPESVPVPAFVGAGLLCGLASLANPYLEEGALFPFVLFRKFTVDQAFYSSNIGEFLPPIEFLKRYGVVSLYLNAEIMLWLLATMSFILLAVRGRVNIFRSLIFVAFSYLAWKASRNTNIFSIVAGSVLAENISDIMNAPTTSTTLPRNNVRSRPLASPGVGLLLVLMIIAVVTGTWNAVTEKNRPFRLGEARSWFAHNAAKFMNRPGFPQRVFASNFGVASVYTYHNGPNGKVFMDGRLEVCSQRTFAEFNEICRRMSLADSSWAEVLRDTDGNLPAVMLDSRYSRGLIAGVDRTPGWRLVFADQAAAVFFDERVAEALHLPAASPDPLLSPPPW